MTDFTDAFAAALGLILGGDPELVAIVLRSLSISLSATVLAGLVGLPFGALVAVSRFPGRRAVVVVLNALMGLPPVVVGLVVYLLLSRAGPLGPLGLLFTPAAMVIAQACLITPIIAALARADGRGSARRATTSCSARSASAACAPSRHSCGTGGSASSPRSWPASAGPRPRSAPSSSSAATSTR